MESNSESMKDLVVETFYQEEIAPLIYDEDKLNEWKELNKELGMVGQGQLQSTPDSDPIPFMHMKTKHQRILTTMCPASIDYKSFNITPIPLPILKAIGHAVRENMFTQIEICWDDKAPDPAVIGTVKRWGEWNDYSYVTKEEAENALGKKLGNYNYENQEYLIGRWGDVRLDWESLETKAIARRLKEQRLRAEERLRDAQREIDDLIINTEKYFA